MIADLGGKGGRVRTVAVPMWVKRAINARTTIAGIEEGKARRSVSKSGKIVGEWAVWPAAQPGKKPVACWLLVNAEW